MEFVKKSYRYLTDDSLRLFSVKISCDYAASQDLHKV